MMLRRKDNPDKFKYYPGRYIQRNIFSVYREEEGLYEVYHDRNLIGSADNETEADHIVEDYLRTA